MRKSLLAAALACLACAPASAGSDGAPAAPVKICGAVVALTEASCIGVRNGEQTYEISSAKPRPAVGDVIVLSGTPSEAMTTCMEGTHLAKVTWTKVIACPTGRPTGY
jgi:hypothetical protein